MTKPASQSPRATGRRAKRKPARPTLTWNKDIAEDGSINYWATIKSPHDLHFSVCVHAAGPRARTRRVDLSAWVGEGDEPAAQITLTIPASRSTAWIEIAAPAWQWLIVQRTTVTLENQAAFVRYLLSS